MCHLLSKVSSIFSNALRSSKSAVLALALVLTSSFAITAQASVSGDWRLAPVADALSFATYWSNVDGDVQLRYCLFDDVYSFNDDGSFTTAMDNLTWVEGWQSGVADGCAAPVAPHDGTTPATYTYDSDANTLTLTGNGAFVGLAKAVNGSELAAGVAVPDTRTYTVLITSPTSMTLSIDVGGNAWAFKLVTDASVAAPSAPVLGCTNDSAINYDADATQDDGSCDLGVPASPVPTDAANEVLSFFSDTYTNRPETDFDPWGGATVVKSDGDFLTYTGLDYQGTEFPTADVSAYGYINIDFYTTDATVLEFTIISTGPKEKLISLANSIVLDQWNNVQIPLEDFTDVDLTDVFQFKVVGNGTVSLDNLYFGGTAPVAVDTDGDGVPDGEDYAPEDPNVQTAPSTAYCATKVTHFNLEAETASAVLLSVNRVDANNVSVSVASADADPVDLINIGGQSNPASLSPMTLANGVATITLTWANGAPDSASFEVLWSKESMGGNWMLRMQDLPSVNTATTCDTAIGDSGSGDSGSGDSTDGNTDPAPAPDAINTYCATELTHFNIAGHTAAIRLTVENSGDDSITVTGSAADVGASALDHFVVNNVSSNSGTPVTTISDTGVGTSVISWPAGTMPAYTTFELHWSDDVFDGQLYVRSGDGNDALGYVDTAYVCPLDSDSDGVADTADAFPNNASESADSDNDGVGDNADYAPNDPLVQTAPEPQMDIVSIVFNFEDSAVGYIAYDGVTASYASQDDAGVTRNMLKLVNAANSPWWSGVTLAVTPAGNNFRGDGSAPATMRVYAEQGGNLNLELEADGQDPAFVNLAVTQGWNDLSFDFSDADAAINWHKIQVRPDALGGADNVAETTYYIDDVTFPNASMLDSDGDGVNDLVDDLPNDATETVDSDGDGFGDNADELPNDSNYSTQVAYDADYGDDDGDGRINKDDYAPNDASIQDVPLFDPASTAPTDAAESVLSIFSDAYTDLADTDFNPNWGQATTVTVADDVITYTGLNYQGTEFTSSDVSGYGHINIDFYTTNATDLQFTIISPGSENLISLTDQIVLDQWVSVAIPLADYALNGVDLTAVNQLKTVGNNTVVLDNLYFSGLPTDRDNDGVIDINDYAPDDPAVTEAPITKYCAKEVSHFNLEAEAGKSILLSVSKSGDNSIEVNASRNSTVSLIDYMAISVPDAGATVSDETIVDGVATATISWVAMPDNTTFEIQWSEEGDLGNQMLKSGTGTDALGLIDTQDSCSEAHPTPVLSIPTTPAPAPAYDANGVISVYSDQFDDPVSPDYKTSWSTSNSVMTVLDISGDSALSYSGLGFVGMQLEPIDATAHVSFNADVWSAVDAVVDIKIVADADNNKEASWTIPVDSGVWTPFTISDITAKFDVPVNAITQILISVVELNDNAEYVQTLDADGKGVSSIVVDNLYFYDKDYVPPTPVSLSVYMPGATEVRLVTETVGSDWDPTLGYVATDNQDGTWTYELSPGPSEDLPYLWAADGVLENLKDNYDLGECATNNLDAGLTYANRILVAGSGDVTDDHFGACQSEVTFSVSVDDTVGLVHMVTSPNFSADDAETAVYNEVDKVWTVTFETAPASDIQYRWVADGIQENLTGQADAGLCINDGLDTENNRNWVAGSGNVSGEIFNECTSPIYNFSATFSEDVRTYSWQDIGPDRDLSTNTEVKADIDDANNFAAYSRRQKTGPISFQNGGGQATFFNGTFFIATENDETIGFTFKEDEPVMSMRVRSASAGKPVSIKLEDADGNHGVMAKAYTSAVDTWETLYFDFSRPYWGDTVYSAKYSRIIVIYDEYSEATADQFFWFDDITYGDVVAPAKTGPSIALPVDFEEDATAYAIGANGGSNSFVEMAPDGSTTALKYVKSGDRYGSGNITLDTPINFKDGYKFSVEVYSTVARELTMKFDDASSEFHPVQRSLPMSGNGWETLTFDFSESALMPQGKISFIQDILTQGSTNESLWTIYIDNITQVASAPYVPAVDAQTFTLDAPSASSVRLIAEWNWDINSPESPIAYFSGDGLWTVELEVAQTSPFEYLWVVDGQAEDLSDNVVDNNCDANLDAGTLVTDADDVAAAKLVNDAKVFDYVNRKWLAGKDTSDTYDKCASRVVLTLKVENPATTVAVLREDINDFQSAQDAIKNDDGTWSYEMNPLEDISYKWVVDGNAENMITNYSAGECANDEDDGIFVEFGNINTNRIWKFGSGNVVDIYHACSGTITGFDDTDGDSIINLNDSDDDNDGVNDNSDVLPYDARFSDFNKAAIASVFGGAKLDEDSPVYSFPTGAEEWAGFANKNTTLYPMTVAEESVITFTGSVPAGGDADVRFKLERLAHNAEGNGAADTEPSFSTAAVTVSGAGAATYSVNVPSQGTKTFSSFLMYLDTRDVDVMVKDVTISSVGPGDTDGDGFNDDVDAFPADSSEWLDSDNDSVGDNADAFPNNASETVDSDNDGVGDNADFAPNDPLVSAAPAQKLVSVKGNPEMVLGESVAVTIAYDTSDDSLSNGLGLRVHFDSSVLTFVSFDDVLEDSKISAAGPYADDDDHDNNGQTDKYMNLSWAAVNGGWPESLPDDLATINFTAALDFAGETTPITFTASSAGGEYGFSGDAYDMGIYVDTGSWDFDKNGQADALTDGLMLLRYAFGLRGGALTAGAIASDLSQAEVEQNVADATLGLADIDGNGGVDALTDGLMLLRYLFGLRGDPLIAGAIATGSSRPTADDVEAYIISKMPQ